MAQTAVQRYLPMPLERIEKGERTETGALQNFPGQERRLHQAGHETVSRHKRGAGGGSEIGL